MEFICSACGKRVPVSAREAQCACGGLWRLDYPLPKSDLEKIDRNERSMFRYRAFMALDDDTAWRSVSLGEGMTPVVRLNGNVLLRWTVSYPPCPSRIAARPC